MTAATASAHGKEYVSLKCICLLYMNTAVASEETITLWEASVAAMAGEEGVFDIRQCKQYTDMLKKSTINCLERALKSATAWVEFQERERGGRPLGAPLGERRLQRRPAGLICRHRT